MKQNYINQNSKKKLVVTVIVFTVLAVMVLSQTIPNTAAELSVAEKKEIYNNYLRAMRQGVPEANQYLESVFDKIGVDNLKDAQDLMKQWGQELTGGTQSAATPTATPTPAATSAPPATTNSAPSSVAPTVTDAGANADTPSEGLPIATIAIAGTVAAVAAVGGFLGLRYFRAKGGNS